MPVLTSQTDLFTIDFIILKLVLQQYTEIFDISFLSKVTLPINQI